MRRLTIIIALVLAISTMSLQADAIESRKKALIEELVTLSQAREAAVDLMLQLVMTGGHTAPTADQIAEAQRSMKNNTEMTKIVERTYDLYDRFLTEQQLRDAITFFRSETGQQYASLQAALATEGTRRIAAAAAESLQGALEKSRVIRTLADIRTLATATEGYGVDHNAYPTAATFDELINEISPMYIRTVPRSDAWGTPFVYLVSKDQRHYRFVSAGPDRRIAEESTHIGSGNPKTANDDIIYEDGQFVQPQKPQ